MKRNIIISIIIGSFATYLPFIYSQWEPGEQFLGAICFSWIAWLFVQSSEPQGRRKHVKKRSC